MKISFRHRDRRRQYGKDLVHKWLKIGPEFYPHPMSGVYQGLGGPLEVAVKISARLACARR